MKKLLTRSYFVIVFALFISCESRFEITREQAKIEEARKWFESNILSDAKNQVADPTSTSSIEKEIFWNRARKLPGKSMPEGYAFPIWYEAKARFGKQSIRELWIYKKTDGKMAATIVEVIATPEHFFKYGRRIEFKNFSGIISFHGWNEGLLGGFFVNKNGRSELVTDYKFKQKDQKEILNDPSARVSDCGYQVSYIRSNGIGGIMWVSQPCFDWNAYYASYIMNMYVMNLYTNASYLEQMLNEQYGCEYQGNCQAPTSNNYYPEPEPVDYEKQARDEFNYYKIDDSKLKPCMQSIVGELKGITNGSVAEIIQKFSGAIPTWNWEIKDGLLATNLNGITSALNRSSGTVTTTIDTQKFLSSTDIAIARTLMHESIHAYLVGFFANDPLLANGEYHQLVTAWNTAKRPDLNELHHDEMVRSFVDDIAAALAQYSYSKGYDIPYQTLSDLSWGGLQDTRAFKNLPYSDRKRINDIISTEQYGIDSNGNTKVQTGRPANC